MMKHTPEPWAKSEDCAPDMAHHPFCVRDAAGWSIAYVSGFTNPTADANARLISAAPDMLAALEQVLEFHAKCEREDAIDWQWFDAAYYAARAAIAKARGED